MSDRLNKFDLSVTSEFARILAAVCAFYAAVYYLEYVDAEYSLWLTWLLTPLIITFLLPGVLIVLIYTSAVIFHIYKLYRLRLVRGVQGDWRNAARLAVCALWDAHGWLWHGYEISGLDNIPEGPCLFIYYHGALPIDMYYFIGRMYLLTRRLVHTVADRFMFKIPGWSIALDGLCVIPGTVQTCTGILKAGNKLAISPGGVYEAQFGDHNYQLNWKSRIGFAKVALEAKVPIVPLFTQNVREAFRTVGWLRWVWLRIYQATRIPLAPVYGGFPVKLLTHVGEPIAYDPTLTPQQLQVKVAKAIEGLVEEHQRLPGSILRALTERIFMVPKKPRKTIEKLKAHANGTCGNGKLHAPVEDKEIDNIRLSEKYVDRNEDVITKLTNKTEEKTVVRDEITDGSNGTPGLNIKIKQNGINMKIGTDIDKVEERNNKIQENMTDLKDEVTEIINEAAAKVTEINKLNGKLPENEKICQEVFRTVGDDISTTNDGAVEIVTAVKVTDDSGDRTAGGEIKVS